MAEAKQKQNTTLTLRPFPIEDMKQDRNILLIGARGTGKSTLLKDLAYRMRKKMDFALAMSPTLDTREMLSEFLPESFIYNEYLLPVVQVFITTMTALKEKHKVRHGMLITDDCMYDKTMMKSKEMREIHMNGRHLGICYINSVQYITDCPPDIRANVDYIFVLNEKKLENQQRLYKFFFGMFDTFQEFRIALENCTQNFECLVLDNTSRTSGPEQCVYYYKADSQIQRFSFGRRVFYRLDHHYHKTPENGESEEESQKTRLPSPPKIRLKYTSVKKIQ